MKSFDEWNKVKKKIDSKDKVSVKTGSIWFCNFGINVGYEIDGKNEDFLRPALVLLGFGKSGGIVLPLTTSDKRSKFLIKINIKSSINLTQIKYLDSRRFYRFLYFLNKKDLLSIIARFKGMF